MKYALNSYLENEFYSSFSQILPICIRNHEHQFFNNRCSVLNLTSSVSFILLNWHIKSISKFWFDFESLISFPNLHFQSRLGWTARADWLAVVSAVWLSWTEFGQIKTNVISQKSTFQSDWLSWRSFLSFYLILKFVFP